MENYEIAENLLAAGLQEKALKLIKRSRVCRDYTFGVIHKQTFMLGWPEEDVFSNCERSLIW